MNIIRRMLRQIESQDDFMVGDQIYIGKYSATCQKVTDHGAIFMLDQYLDKPYQMNSEWTNECGYETSDLRRNLSSDFAVDKEFDTIREHLVPFENGDLVRIPTVGEFFGQGDWQDDWYVMDDAEQWALMKIRSNRIANREGEVYEWGWLQNKAKESSTIFAYVDNKVKESATIFAYVDADGSANYYDALASSGVRPVFIIKL